MHYTTVNNPISLVHRERGVIQQFTNFDHLVTWWPHLRRFDIGPAFKTNWDRDEYNRVSARYYWLHSRDRSHPAWPPSYRYYEYVLRDSFGDLIDPQTVRDRYRELNSTKRWAGKWFSYPGRKRKNGHYYRRLRTTQERRWAGAWDDEEFAPKVRASRNERNLPDAWDDYRRSCWENSRSWKNYRKHQWKDKS